MSESSNLGEAKRPELRKSTENKQDFPKKRGRPKKFTDEMIQECEQQEAASNAMLTRSTLNYFKRKPSLNNKENDKDSASDESNQKLPAEILNNQFTKNSFMVISKTKYIGS